MGLFDYLRRRRERESAVAGLSSEAELSQRVEPTAAWSMGGSAEASGGELPQGMDLAQLGQIGALIAQAAKSGNIEVHQGQPQEIDLRGTGLREDIMGILAQHGIDAQATGQQIDASQVPGMPEEILDALREAGVNLEPPAPG